jgi:hypothetical protein
MDNSLMPPEKPGIDTDAVLSKYKPEMTPSATMHYQWR